MPKVNVITHIFVCLGSRALSLRDVAIFFFKAARSCCFFQGRKAPLRFDLAFLFSTHTSMPTASAPIMMRSISIVVWTHEVGMRRRRIPQKEIKEDPKKWDEQNHGPEQSRSNLRWTTHPKPHDNG